MRPLLELHHIRRAYRNGDAELRALDDVSLAVWPGEFVAIMGQSGSGKSTLMNIIGCLDTPSSGTYRVRGQDVRDMDPDALAALRRDTFGFVFQRYNLLPSATASENVEIPGIYAATPKPERSRSAGRLLTRLGLADRAHHRPGELSGGQQQRVAIARALMNDPPIILADEPTGALDSKSSAEVMQLLKELHAEGRTILLITHDEEVAQHAERMVILRDGNIVEERGPLRTDRQSPTIPARGHASIMPELAEASRTAMRSLKANKFRTALTLLGIVIGVASVIIMMAVGKGSTQQVLDQITAMGTNLLSVRPGAPGVRGGEGNLVTLIPDDAAAIAEIPGVALVVPERNGRLTVRYGNIDAQTTVQAVGADMPYARDWFTRQGTFFTERDVQSYAPVVVLGQTVATNLFPGSQDPVGRFILIKNVPFEVIGVLTPKGAAGWGGDQDDAVFVPLTTGLIRLLGGAFLGTITVKVDSMDALAQVEKDIQALLLERHRKEDFQTRNMASFVEMATQTQQTLTLLLGAVAAISLLVGGIGVMNIMLVSVTERTREIGIRMAAGARRRDIMLQFNTEAAVVCVIGGLLGVLFGFAGGGALSLLAMDVIFSAGPAMVSFACAVLTGLVFGIWPAYKASRLDPVAALASE